MYGLPADVDLSFLRGAQLLQVCAGENEVVLNLVSEIQFMVASAMRITLPDASPELLDDSRKQATHLMGLLGHEIRDATGDQDGTLRLTWPDGTVVEILDDSPHYESYWVRHGEERIIV